MAKTAIEVQNLVLQRGEKKLFSAMNWKLPAGSFLAVKGVSGVGKTSLLSCLGGILPPTEGKISFGDNPAPRIGFIFQNLRLTPNLSVLQNVLCGKLENYAWYQTLFSFPRADREEAYKYLSELGLANYVHQRTSKISGGEQQRTAIARVLLQKPGLVLADEPTSNLDKTLAEKSLSLLRRDGSALQQTIICILHDSDLVQKFADFELEINPHLANGWNFRKIT